MISTFSRYVNQSSFVPEQRCLDRFWHSTVEMYLLKRRIDQRCETEGIDAYIAMREFYHWVRLVVPVPEKCMFITDNAGLVAGILRAFSDRDDPLYAFGEHRPIIDVNAYYCGYARVPLNAQSLEEFDAETLGITPPERTGTPHDAVSDAIYTAQLWCAFQKKITEDSN